jgi:hypothetical protein
MEKIKFETLTCPIEFDPLRPNWPSPLFPLPSLPLKAEAHPALPFPQPRGHLIVSPPRSVVPSRPGVRPARLQGPKTVALSPSSPPFSLPRNQRHWWLLKPSAGSPSPLVFSLLPSLYKANAEPHGSGSRASSLSRTLSSLSPTLVADWSLATRVARCRGRRRPWRWALTPCLKGSRCPRGGGWIGLF